MRVAGLFDIGRKGESMKCLELLDDGRFLEAVSVGKGVAGGDLEDKVPQT